MRVSELREALSRCPDDGEVIVLREDPSADITAAISSHFGWIRGDGSRADGHVMLRLAEREVSS